MVYMGVWFNLRIKSIVAHRKKADHQSLRQEDVQLGTKAKKEIKEINQQKRVGGNTKLPDSTRNQYQYIDDISV